MFNTVLPYRFVQRDRNRWPREASWVWLDLYRFHIRTPLGVRKYLVEVRAYPDHLYSVDFFAKVMSNHKYRLKTNQFSAGKLGGTVLDILVRVQRADPDACFGFIGAAMLGEDESQGTRRFWMYLKMLERKLDPNHFVVRDDYATSSIFVLPVHRNAVPDFFDQLRQRYERYFRENF